MPSPHPAFCARATTVAAAFLLLTAAALPAQAMGGAMREMRRVYGPALHADYGTAVAWVGDNTGDGRDDYAVASGRHGAPVRVYSGISGALHYELLPADVLAAAGDVDGDGIGDVLSGDVSGQVSAGGTGFVRVHAGSDGTLLQEYSGLAMGIVGFGESVDGVGDLDGDGFDEIAVGASQARPGGRPAAGSVVVYSGADGSEMYRWDGPAAGNGFGAVVCGVGDASGDGVADVLFTSRNFDPPGMSNAGRVFLMSGADGALLWSRSGTADGERLGLSASAAGDVDGDGLGDLLVGRIADGSGPGSAWLLSGADGAVIHDFTLPGAAPGDLYARSLSGGRDVDGDLVPDVAIYAEEAAFTGGRVLLYSGATGEMLGATRGLPNDNGLGQALDLDGDLDGDGLGDLVLGSRSAAPNQQKALGVMAIRTLNPFLYPSTSALSVSAGQPLTLEMKFPFDEGGERYLLLASQAGHGSTLVGGAAIPLADDPLLQRLLTGDFPRPLNGAAGRLDAFGRASASLTVNPLATSAIGQSVTFCAVTLDEGTLTVRRFSTARRVEIVP